MMEDYLYSPLLTRAHQLFSNSNLISFKQNPKCHNESYSYCEFLFQMLRLAFSCHLCKIIYMALPAKSYSVKVALSNYCGMTIYALVRDFFFRHLCLFCSQ